MRIQAGAYKGRRLLVDPKVELRPTEGRVRMALFNILGESVEGSSFLDLFAGTGSVGFEAASRGAKEVHFVEQENLLAEGIRKTLEKIGVNGRMWEGPAIYQMERMRREALSYDLIFVDPPYQSGFATDALWEIGKKNLLSASGTVIIERHRKSAKPKAEELEAHGWASVDERAYGSVSLEFYQRRGA